ncbi:MAG: hypothetical protein ACQEWF_12110 [Bacillota bacterium]
MANEPNIYDENSNGKVTKVTHSEEGMKIEQYHPESGMNVIAFDPAEVKRLVSGAEFALIESARNDLTMSQHTCRLLA